jgi:Ni/Co efflux regulator RcnB
MKRILIATLAALSFAAPLAVSTASADDDHRRWRHHDRYERHDRYDRDWDDRDDRRDERRAYREGYRDGRHFDRGRHNGYYVGRSWYYGPPPSAYYARHDYRPDYRAWRRGDRLPHYYRDHYRPVDYRYHHLAPPPRGAHWVRDDRGDYLLIGIATGVILGLALSN